MRIRLALVVGLCVGVGAPGCTSGRSVGGADVEGGVVAREAVPPASVPATGPREARELGRDLGLEVSDTGASVAMRGPTLLARVFPGKTLLLLNGRSVAMAEPARRDGADVIVPTSGVEAIRRGLAASRVAPPVLPPLTAFRPPPKAPARVALVPSVASLGSSAGDAGWVPLASAETRPWSWIVVHHSDDVSGCCSKYDAAHRAKGWDECGYHFVIGNGSMTADGQVEVTGRWPVQKHGAHAKTPDNRYNDFGIGIVLVGDFEKGPGPSAAQYASLLRLTRWLMARYGVTADRVIKHGDTKATACPGRNFPWGRFQGDLVSFASIESDRDRREAGTSSDGGERADPASVRAGPSPLPRATMVAAARAR